MINDPLTLAELTACCDRYEAALMANDLAVLDALFWASPHVLRYGVGETLYGIEAIRAFRRARVGGSPPRSVLRRVVTTYGDDHGSCSLEFRRDGDGALGRQSQTWILTEAGWRIAAAHVSLMA